MGERFISKALTLRSFLQRSTRHYSVSSRGSSLPGSKQRKDNHNVPAGNLSKINFVME